MKRPKNQTGFRSKNEKKDSSEGFLLLQDGSLFRGLSFGADTTAEGELVFHTSPTGYPEILTDPSYCRQILCFAAPQIGNQGVHHDDFESERVWASACLVRDYWDPKFHWRKQKSLAELLQDHGVPALQGIDTRSLIQKLRNEGSQWAIVSSRIEDLEKIQKTWKPQTQMQGLSLVDEVTTSKAYRWTMGSLALMDPRWKTLKNLGKRCVLLDFGVKRQILRYLIDAGFEEVWVLPAKTKLKEIESLHPDAVVLSNGPGDPGAEQEIVAEVKQMIGQWPILGICLGHQLLGIAMGVSSYKLKFGHRAANHPVSLSYQRKSVITSQNHGFAIQSEAFSEESLHMNDRSLAGFIDARQRVAAFQFHPEASPGPLDTREVFRQFREGEWWQ
jgi:carbamoyl-phosphate synthase small subunit